MELLQLTGETKSIINHLTKAIVALAGVTKPKSRIIEFKNTRWGTVTVAADKIVYIQKEENSDGNGVLIGLDRDIEIRLCCPGTKVDETYADAVAKWRDAQ